MRRIPAAVQKFRCADCAPGQPAPRTSRCASARRAFDMGPNANRARGGVVAGVIACACLPSARSLPLPFARRMSGLVRGQVLGPAPALRRHAAACTQGRSFFLDPGPPAWRIEMEKWPYHTPAWKQWLADRKAGKPVDMPAE